MNTYTRVQENRRNNIWAITFTVRGRNGRGSVSDASNARLSGCGRATNTVACEREVRDLFPPKKTACNKTKLSTKVGCARVQCITAG